MTQDADTAPVLPVQQFMATLADNIDAILPAGMAAGVVGDWVVVTTRYGLDGYEAAAGLDADAPLRTIQGRVFGTLNVVQEAVVRHTTEPWPTLRGAPRRAPHGNVWLPDVVAELEGAAIHPFFGFRVDHGNHRVPPEWHGEVVLDLPRLSWPPAKDDASPEQH